MKLPNGKYLAHLAGTVVGVVHKGESIIEHRLGMGAGDYGGIQVNTALVPAVGSRVKMTVTRLSDIQQETTTSATTSSIKTTTE